jgi:type 1 glutamine amidotransferase
MSDNPRMPKSAGAIVCTILLSGSLLAQTPAPRITATFPPPADIREPDLTIAAVDKGAVGVLAYDPNGRFLATSGPDGVIKLWETRPGEQGTGVLVRTLGGNRGRVLALAPGPTNDRMVSVSDDQSVRLWDETNGHVLRTTPLAIGTDVKQIAILGGKTPLLAVSNGHQVKIWNYETMLPKALEGAASDVTSLALGPDGKALAVGTSKGAIEMWDLEAGARTRTIDAGSSIRALALSAVNVAATTADGSLQIWSLDPQAVPGAARALGHKGAIEVLAFDLRGEQLASAGADKTVKMWDVQTGTLLCSQEGHAGDVLSLSFSSNGQKLASGSADGTARTWTVPLLPISPASLAKITSALPLKATAAPRRPRRILVFWRADAILHKGGVPAVNHTIELMGAKTGAYEADFSRDFAVFDPNVLAKYDAIVLNSTAHLVMPEHAKKAYLDYVSGGGGVIAIHAAIDTFLPWPEGAKVVGATFGDHPWTPTGTWAVKLEEPAHPLLRAFGGKGFKIKDEFYVMGEPFSRADRRVLMSVDLSDPASAGVNLNANPGRSKDHDFALAWVKHYGAGRVFYAVFGHLEDPFWRPEILQFYLDGIQYVLGDLKVDDSPMPSH